MSKRIDEMDLWALSAIFISRPGAVVQGRASVSRKAAFCATFSKKVALKCIRTQFIPIVYRQGTSYCLDRSEAKILYRTFNA